MTQITCACFDCKFCDENAQCIATEIKITSGNISTMWEGRQDVWWCKSFEKSDEAKAYEQKVALWLKGLNGKEKT